MDVSAFPKRNYIQGYTPIEKMERLSSYLGGPELYMKRDDLTGLPFGGNKTRKLEYLMADALAQIPSSPVVRCSPIIAG